MPAEKPTFYTPDFFEKAQRERSLPQLAGAPEFEAAVILAEVHSSPGLPRSLLIKTILARMNRPMSDERVYLRYLDALISLREIAQYDFGYSITPIGIRRLRALKIHLNSAMNFIQNSTP